MKKLIAVILALLLLGSTFAFAEEGSALDLKDPVLDLTVDGEAVQLDLTGLTLRFGVLGEGDDALFVLNILGNEELLFKGAARVDGGRILFTADGLSSSYAVAMPAAGLVGSGEEDGDDAMAAVGAELMEKLMAEAEIGMEGDAVTFRLPYTAVNAVLREFAPMMDQIPNLDELMAQLDEMEAQGQGFELAGSVSMTDGIHVELNVIPVEGGESAAEPAFTLLFDVKELENGADFYMSLLVPSEGDAAVFQLEGSFRDEEDGAKVQLKLFLPSSGSAAPVGTLDLDIGEDFSLRLEAADAFRFEVGFVKAESLLTLTVDAEGLSAKLTAKAVSGEAELVPCVFPDGIVELGEELSEEQSAALSAGLMNGLAPVLNFLLPSLSASGLLG